VRHCVQIAQVIESNDINVVRVTFTNRAEDLATNAPKTINAYTDFCHLSFSW
jgi:hypothetical protein